jgi:hypothetical protein
MEKLLALIGWRRGFLIDKHAERMSEGELWLVNDAARFKPIVAYAD